MIAGVFIRNFKTYQGINYVPVSDSSNLSGFLGNNGIGKSSVLEALDCVFNDSSWNLNIVVKKSGLEKTEPYIVPFFILEHDFFDSLHLPYAQTLDKIARTITVDDSTNPATKSIISDFIHHRDRIISRGDVDGKFLIPIGQNHEGKISLSVFKSKVISFMDENEFGIEFDNLIESEEYVSLFQSLYIYICNALEYLYIPKEIDSESFTKLESMGTQVLMGESLHKILDRIVGDSTVSQINKELNGFLEDISGKLISYSYRTPTDRQKRIQKREVYNLIIEAFFNVRKLHKNQGSDYYLEINSLSSGEKQKAIIDVAHALLTKHRQDGGRLIIAIDEPESSLHMSACFEQFNALAELSHNCRQLLFSSHWYGFLPTLDCGCVTIITKKDSEHKFDLINLASYREEVRQLISSTNGKMPFDIRIKSINDFIQSIVTSATGDNPYNWIICEGTSEKVYLSDYFKDLMCERNLRIIPVGGAKEVKRIYEQLAACHKDISAELTGVIYLLSDTDVQQVKYPVEKLKNIYCKRIVFDKSVGETVLVDINGNPSSPATAIEDCLNGQVFHRTLMTYVSTYPQISFIATAPVNDCDNESFNYYDLRTSEKDAILGFFAENNMKYEFALKYNSEKCDSDSVPDWIQNVKETFLK
ncbi:TPA: ATP-binding protein [Escherichia coli]|nr:ATP-binding protein [Escherichia coli]HAZ3911880.1 ATP-binding protein [Escherichia coli]